MTAPRTKWIIHLDLDSFFAAVEVLDNPELKGKPVIVGGLGPRGVVSTASYEARAYGVHSALPMSRAKALCPHGVFLWVRMDRYHEFSEQVMDIFHRYTPLVEPLSLDEAFLDVTGSISLFGSPPDIARRIKNEVNSETGLTISAGVATQKHLAKIASGMNKPDGLTIVPEGKELDFLRPLDLKELWGAGKVTLAKLHALGLKTVGDLAKYPRNLIGKKMGETGLHLWELANGHDDREVCPYRESKSLGAEETYDEDISGKELVSRELLGLSVKVAARLRASGYAGRTLTVKLRDGNFKTITRSKTLAEPLEDHMALFSLALNLVPTGKWGPYRLLGIQVSNLLDKNDMLPEPPQPQTLFDLAGPKLPRCDPKLTTAMDLINTKFGSRGLTPATLLEKKPRSRGERLENGETDEN
ncbi:MAG: DNA polymerase IV [Deltaproteobacteria bacterium]|nr:DNA polymerase IV [Deltaproteobacteria bacterium]